MLPAGRLSEPVPHISPHAQAPFGSESRRVIVRLAEEGDEADAASFLLGHGSELGCDIGFR